MRLVVERNVLLKALGHITGIVERRNTIPILSNVLISGEGGDRLTLKATDLDIEAVEMVPARIGQPGAVTIAAHTLHDIVRKLPEGVEIKMELLGETGRLKVAAARSSFELAILPADDFPNMGQAELPCQFELPASELKRLFEKARFAMSTEETRYYLNGIFFHAFDGPNGRKVRAVATDGHRLAQIESDCPAGARDMPGVIVPRKAVAEIVKLLDGEAPVRIALSQSKIRFAVGDVILTSKLVDGSFPDYARVIPTANKKQLTIDNADLVKAVDRVSTLSSERSRAVKLEMSQGELTITAHNPETGSASEKIPVEYQGEPLEIGFNAKYLLDIAAQIDGPRTQFRLADSSSPSLVTDESDSSALYVLMPMRV